MMGLQTNNTKEIDVVGALKKVLAEKRLLLKFCIVFSIIGVIVALSIPRVYTSTVVLAPENSTGSSALSKFGALGSMIGINVGPAMDGDALYPEIYPDIFASNDFIVDLFDVPVVPLDSIRIRTYYNHLAFDGKIPFWQYPKIWITKLLSDDDDEWAVGKPVDPFRLTRKQENMVKLIKSNISCLVDKKTSVITIGVTDIDPFVAAVISDSVKNKLQRYITDYRTSKARQDLEYVTKMCKQCEEEYEDAQSKYAKAADANRNVNLVRVSSEITKLENDMQLKYNSYSAAMQQLQISRQQVQINTPVFTVIQKPSVPTRPSGMPKAVICILYFMLGVVLDGLWVLFIRDWWKSSRFGLKKRKEK